MLLTTLWLLEWEAAELHRVKSTPRSSWKRGCGNCSDTLALSAEVARPAHPIDASVAE